MSPTSNDHYCLIAVVQTPTHRVSIPQSFELNARFVQWVQDNPGVGWRNVSYQPNTSIQFVRLLNFGNLNSSSAYFHFYIEGQNFVTNTSVTAQCTNSSCPINQNNMKLPAPDRNGKQITGFDTSVPANFSDAVTVTLTSPSGPFPTNATLKVIYLQYPDSGNELDMQMARPIRIAKATEGGSIYHDTPMLIKLGECTTIVTNMQT